MKARSKRKGIFSVKSIPVDPASLPPPVRSDEYENRGMSYYARKDYDKAAEDFQKALSMDPTSEDAYYGLGIVYKAARKNDEAVQAFQKLIALVAASTTDSHNRKEMLRRLALGHINEIVSGDWNLEKEIWKHVP
jgi:tetratricopeptide (TPR) repeat protein